MPSFKMKFLGVTILQGVEFSIFPIDFEWTLQQCSATALPVIFSFKFRSAFASPDNIPALPKMFSVCAIFHNPDREL